jgi:hypothetical protein
MRFVSGLSFMVLSALTAFAQTSSSITATSGVLGGSIGPVRAGVVSNSGWFISGSGGQGLLGGSATGAPYSAEQVTEKVQTLADGTHITQPAQTTKFYRDSQGRTRVERSFPLPPGALAKVTEVPGFVEISDPVAGVRYTLETQNRTAHRMPMPAATQLPPPASTSAPAAKMIRLLPARLPSQSASIAEDQALRPQLSHESLGTQTIEGVLAEGSRMTVTYPVGAVGNDRPITAVSETWMSPELNTVVLSKNSDPRNGESTTRLINISRAEPDASLFQIPPDYEVIDPQPAVPKP